MRRLLVTLKGAYNITWHRSDELTLWKSIFWLTHIYARNKWWENEIDLSVDSSFYLPCFGIIWSICWSMDMHHTLSSFRWNMLLFVHNKLPEKRENNSKIRSKVFGIYRTWIKQTNKVEWVSTFKSGMDCYPTMIKAFSVQHLFFYSHQVKWQ